jgi:hypothetical protein
MFSAINEIDETARNIYVRHVTLRLSGIWNYYGSMLFAYGTVMPAGAD